MWWRKSPYKIAKTKIFDDDFNKTRQSASDVIEQEGRRPYRYSDASQKITSELAEVSLRAFGEFC